MATSTSTILSDSISSLSSSTSQPPSISRTFKQAQQLFISRQLSDAWDVLVPVLTIPRHGDDADSFDQAAADAPSPSPTSNFAFAGAPIAQATKPARIKVWSLYIALVHAILELGSEEGGSLMGEVSAGFSPGMNGGRRWGELSKRVRDGDIWEEVVRDGYSGVEGAVEGEVVCNLATLLLTHAPKQNNTQSRLETYLSSSSSGPSPSHLADTLQAAQSQAHDTISTPRHTLQHTTNGTSTPRDLGTRLKLLEIFTLHVLPRNEEWDYAREFINMSETLDEERKEAFLAALGTLRDSSAMERRREEELMKRREEEAKKPVISDRSVGSGSSASATSGSITGGVREVDFGIEGDDAHREGSAVAAKEERTKPAQNGHAAKPTPTTAPTAKTVRSQTPISTPAKAARRPAPSSSSKRPPPKANTAAANSTILARAHLTLSAINRLLAQTAHTVTRNPMVVVRFLLFMIALVIGLARRDVRERLQRAWAKIAGTVGMGTKVGYL